MTGKQFAVIATITFIVGMIWLVSDIIFNTKASIPVSPQLETALSPLNPSFNSRILDLIGQEVSGVDLEAIPVPKNITTIPSPSIEQSSTGSGQLQ